MHIHLPKPLHGWREFIGEVGIIVIGVLLALGAESVLERWHWQDQTEHTREALKLEVHDGAVNAWERLLVGQCLRTRLGDLLDKINSSDGSWIGSPMLRQNGATKTSIVVTPAYAPPSRVYQTDAWKNALVSGSFNHFPRGEAADYSDVFTALAELDVVQREEAAAATKLAPLSFDRHLDERARADMIAAIAEVDRNLALIKLITEQALETVRHMHLGFDREKLRKEGAEILERQRHYRGLCVRPMPLDLN